jgi:uncharacterized delta-60 repeat protein
MVTSHDLLLWFLAPLLAVQMVAPTRHLSLGDLDTSFGRGGKVTTGFAGPGEAARAVFVQPDGKIVVGGRAGVSHRRDFALVRYNIDGSLDRTFGLRGRLRTDLGGRNRVAALALQPDGKIVAAGTTTLPGADFALARYDANGDLDPTFGTGGIVRTDFAGGFDSANALAIQPDGKLVVAGYAVAEHRVGFALVRYNEDGTIDTTFGSGGKTFTAFSDSPSEIQAVAFLPDGKILAAGFSSTPSTFGRAFALARYHPNGTLDASFGNGGRVTTTFASDDTFAYALAMQADGKAVVAGRTGVGSETDFALARYNSDGSLDETFGRGGMLTTDLAGHRDIAFAVVAQIDGGVVVAGRSGAGPTPDFALVRYTASGSLDASFGEDGKVTTDFDGQLDVAYACTLQPDGRIVVVGRTGPKPRTAFAAARYEV